jgi:hypothetical protein
MKATIQLLTLGFLFLGYMQATNAQNPAQKTQYKLQKTKENIVLDGELNETVWRTAELATNFHMNIPYDDRPATMESEVRMTYDEENFYFAITCFDGQDGYVVQSLRRDWDWPLNENFSIYLDPYNDFTNGFSFGITPYGVQREGTIDEGTNVNEDWDNKWFSNVKRYDDRWVAEIAIPFKSIRYSNENRVWNMQFFRNHLKRNERSTWIAVEQQFTPSALTFSGQVLWPENPPPAGTNISFIPYALGNYDKNYTDPELEKGLNANAGFDAKIGLSPSLNLDLTVNPDFSQVEVDRQVINLSRFEVQFPERRQFFLENADLFSKFGFPQSRAFFSRRIGITTDTLGRSEQVPILGGARMSGKLNEKLRIGVLNMLTDKRDDLQLPYQNYSVLALQQNILKRSNVAFVFANKENLGVEKGKDISEYNPQVARREIHGNDTTTSYKLYNRVLGAEFNLFTEDTRWAGDFYYQRSFDNWNQNGTYNHGAFIRYQRRNYSVRWVHTAIGDGFNAEMGFVPRVGYNQGSFSPSYIFYPENDQIINHSLSFDISYTTNSDFSRITDRSLSLSHNFNFTNTSSASINLSRNYEYMFFDFSPIAPFSDSLLLQGTDYEWNVVQANFISDRRSLLNYDISTSYGGFYNGSRFNLNGNVGYRFQPYGSFSIRYDFNSIQLAEGFGSANFYLLGPRLDLTMTDAIFFTGFAQYNNRFDNVNYNLRFQWRFAPASDVFLVYTENFAPNGPVDFIPGENTKNRALVLKLTYWLNL